MPVFQTGLGINVIKDCAYLYDTFNVQLVNQGTEFIDYGDGVIVYGLWRDSLYSCVNTPTGDFVFEWQDAGGVWHDLCRWTAGQYSGYVYSWCTITNGAGWPLRVKFAGLTINFTIINYVVTCNQPVKVVDKDSDAGIGGVVVAARPSIGTIKKCTTNSIGKCTITGLTEGDPYNIYIDTIPAGYECEYTVDCEELGVVACVTERLFRLKDITPVTCDQPFIVKEEGTGVVILGATITCGGNYCYTGVDGKCTIENLNRDQYYTPAAAHPSYDPPTTPPSSFKACTTIRTLYLKPIAPPTCEYTGYAVNAKIDHDDVPTSASAGSTVTAKIKVDGDCYTPGRTTRGRVKFTVTGMTPVYSDIFTYDCYGETDWITVTFEMPNNNVTLIAEIQRCNSTGNWENAGPDYRKDYPITVAAHEGPYGEILAGYPKIDSDSCTDICGENNLCIADEGERPSFVVKYKNVGDEEGYFRAWLIAFNGYTIAAPNPPEGDGKVLDEEFHVLPTSFKLAAGEEREVTLTPKILNGSMPAEDWSLAIQIAQISSLGIFKEWHGIKPFLVCYEHISTDGYSIEWTEDLPTELATGETYTFKGKLKNNQGRTISNQTIKICEDDVFFDDEIAIGITDADGNFAIPWIVREVESLVGGDQAEFYACYRCEQANEVRSGIKTTIIIITTPFLILDAIPKTLYAGEEYTFTGELTQNGVAIANAQIRIYDKDLIWGDLIGEGVTDENGEFSIYWLIEELEIYGDLEIYAEHLQSGTKSALQKITISKRDDITKLLLYSGVAIGLYVGGGIVGGIGEDVKGVPMKPIGTGLKLIAILPGGMAIYEGYKIVKEKIEFL